MTWLKGTTTWGNLANDLTKLIVGEKADDTGTTCAAGDRWVRCYTRTVNDGVLNSTTTITSATAAFSAADVGGQVIGTGVPIGATIVSVTNATTAVLSAAATASASGVTLQISLDTIRTPASRDVASGNMSNRAGYWTLCSSTSTPPLSGAIASVCKQTNPCTSDPTSSGLHRWVTMVTITTANSVAGNYSTARFSYYVYDMDTGAALYNVTGVTITAAGVGSLPNGASVTFSDPSGILTNNISFVRGFTSTYMYGIDLWPMLSRQGASGPTFSVAPPGVAGTDYDIVQQIAPPNTAPMYGVRGGYLQGLGIKTAAANTGALYTVAWPLALHKGRIYSSTTAGTLGLDVGDSKVDTVNANALRTNGMRVTNWCKVFTTAGSVTASSAVQYFLSVTADGIALVLNGDPGSTGKLANAFFGSLTPTDPSYDVLPTVFNTTTLDYTIDQSGLGVMACQQNYWSLRRLQDGSEGTRDWQTKWMRGEGLTNPYSSGAHANDITGSTFAVSSPSSNTIMALTPLGIYQSSSFTVSSGMPVRQNKPNIDGKWWLWTFQYGEGPWDNNSTSTDENRIVRATNNRVYFLPGDGWGSGDELTDTATGQKYLLVMPDYVGIGFRARISASSYQGGPAVAEL